jgi:chemotaxis family two-component system response regulator Rcp1
MPSFTPPVEVLLVEDSRDDADLMEGALRESALDVRLAHVEDGEAALLYLRRQGAYAAAAHPPDLLLLDMQLPKINGDEVLEELEQDSELRLIPVVVFGTLKKSYDLGAICCVGKPRDQEEFAHVVKTIEQFWIDWTRSEPNQ